MTAPAKATPKSRLLKATRDVVYREGVHVGVDALCTSAGISKRSLYQLFDSKDELLAASLQSGSAAFLRSLETAAHDSGSPRERILAVMQHVEREAMEPGFRGCRYLAMQIELKDEQHPASRVAAAIKTEVTALFLREAEAGGARDPGLLARQLSLVYDGASVRAGIGADQLTGLLAPTVGALLDAAGMR